MIELNVVNFVTIGLIALIFMAIVRWLLGVVAPKLAAKAA